MPVRTTSQAGDWSNSATWGGATPPGIGDTAVINHDVTVDQTLAVGTSPDNQTTVVVEVNGVTLTVAPGVVFIVRGNVALTNAILQVGQDGQAGAAFMFDSSNSTTFPNYICAIGTANNQTSKLISRGSPAGHSLITSELSGSGTAGFFGSYVAGAVGNDRLESCRFDLRDTDLVNIGTASILAIYAAANQGAPATNYNLERCKITNCGDIINSYQLNSDVIVNVIDTRFSKPLGTYGLRLNLSTGGGTPTAARNFLRNTFEAAPVLPIWNAVIRGNYFHNGFLYVQNVGRTAGDVSRNVIRITSGDQIRSGDWDNNLILADGSTMLLASKAYSVEAAFSNPHWTTPVGAEAGVYMVHRCVFLSLGSTGDGDIDYGPNAAGYHSHFEYNIIPPDPVIESGRHIGAGTLATMNGWNGANCQYNHNTHYNGGQGCLALSEGGNGFANMISEFKSNIIWNDTGYSGSAFNYAAYDPTTPSTLVTDSISVGGATNNCMHGIRSDGTNLGPGNTNGRYNIPGSADYGANDIYEDPQFVDPIRLFADWVQYLLNNVHPLTATPDRFDWQSYGLYLLSLHNQSGLSDDYRSEATVDNCLDFIRAGYVPRNQNLRNAGHDGRTMGAVEMRPPGSAMVISRRRYYPHRR